MLSAARRRGAGVRRPAKGQEQATYLTLIGVFAALFGLFATYERRRDDGFALRPFDLALLGLATYRAGRPLANDKVTEPLREPVVGQGGAGGEEQPKPKGTGVRRAQVRRFAVRVAIML